MQSLAASVRGASVLSFATAPEDEELLSDDSLVMSPDHKIYALKRCETDDLGTLTIFPN